MELLDTKILLIFLCGYIFFYFTPLRFRAYDLQPSQLFLESSLAGFIIYLFSIQIFHLAFVKIISYPVSNFIAEIISPIYAIDSDKTPNYISLYSSWTIFITFVLCIISRWFESNLPRYLKLPNARWEILDHSIKETKPLLITLKSKKVYVGFIIRLPKIHHKQKFLKIMPFRSGYRNENDNDLILNNDYDKTLYSLFENYNSPEELPDDIKDMLENYGIVIDIDEIHSVSFWYPKLYSGFKNS